MTTDEKWFGDFYNAVVKEVKRLGALMAMERPPGVGEQDAIPPEHVIAMLAIAIALERTTHAPASARKMAEMIADRIVKGVKVGGVPLVSSQVH